MYFKYDSAQRIEVSKPYKRAMIPFMMGDTAELPVDFSVHITEWEPGSQVDDHMHPDAMEAMFCMSGHGTASVGDQVFDLAPDSMIVAAPGEMHCIRNTGDSLLRCLCIFSPPTTAEGLRSRAYAAVREAEEQGKPATE